MNSFSRFCLALPIVRWLFGWAYTLTRKRSKLGPLWRELEAQFGRTKSWVIFDVGANDAGSGIAYARAFPRAEVHFFEAHPLVAEVARRRVKAAGLSHRGFVHEVAASDAEGTAQFYVSSMPKGTDWRKEVSDSSSLLAPTGHTQHFEHVAFEQTIEVPTVRLDRGIADAHWPVPDFIHMDVQGAELMVMDGLGDHLRHVRCIWLEVEQLELYANQPLEADVATYLTEAGFELVWQRRGKLHGDQLWRRKQGRNER